MTAPIEGGERLITSVQALPTKPNTAPPPPRQDRLTAAGPTPLGAASDLVYYEVMGEAAGGSVVIRRGVSSSAASEAFSRLAGDVSMLFGAPAGGIWADLAGVKPRPPVEQGQNQRRRLRRCGRDASDRHGRRDPGHAVAALGQHAAVDRARRRPTRSSPACCRSGILVALIGAAVTWVLASRIIRPLEELTHAAEDIAGGDLTRHVATNPRDEIGRLGQAFNTMVDKVADGYHQLDERVKERTAELQERTGELEQALTTLKDTQDELVRREKLAMLGQLASGVGHELRNPLAVMTNAVYFLEMIQPDAPPQVHEYHGLLRAQIGLSEKIVGDLLDFARIKPPRRERVPLTRILDDQVARLSSVDGIRIERDVAADLPDAYVDPIQIGQVVFNLLVNALQAMEAQTRSREGWRRADAARQGDASSLERRRAHADARRDRHRSRRRARTAVEDLRGALHHQGARHRPWPVRVAEPRGIQRRHADAVEHARRGRDVHADAAGSALMSAPGTTKGTILVVDDDRQMVKTLTAVLQLKGWSTVSAFSGEEAIQTAKAQRFKAVLMDVRMPGINGVEAFREIRQAQPLTPVILMTAYAAHELLAQAEREGALMVLPKPVPWMTLTNLLDHVGDGRTQHSAGG